MSASLAVLLCAALLAVAGCNTVRGVGQDVESAGSAVSGTAQKVQQGL
jgi:predicted small secreted protein